MAAVEEARRTRQQVDDWLSHCDGNEGALLDEDEMARLVEHIEGNRLRMPGIKLLAGLARAAGITGGNRANTRWFS